MAGYFPPLTSGRVIMAHTSDAPLVNADRCKLHTNRGASGTVTLTCPSSPASGDAFSFAVVTAQILRIDPGGTNTCLLPDGTTTAAGKYLQFDGTAALGGAATLVWDGTLWLVARQGADANWTVEA